jgi:hypothetical protein
MSETVIRTEKWVTITEAHPYHNYVSDERARGGNAVVMKGYDPNCPLCRKESNERSNSRMEPVRP